MNDHYHYDYAQASHDHRGDYADSRHDHDHEYAGKYHRHHDDESTAAGLREDLSRAEARIADLEEQLGVHGANLTAALARIQALEQQTPDARQAELEADLAAAGGDDEDQGDDEAWRDALKYAVASGSADYAGEDGDPHYDRSRRAIRLGEADDDFVQDRHADLDPGENDGAMTDADFYDRTAGGES